MIADYDGDISALFDINYNGPLPILATRNIVMFPGVICPILIGREQSIRLIKDIESNPNAVFGVFCQRSQEQDRPMRNDLYEYGVYAKLVKVIEMPMPGSQRTAIIQALGRCALENITDVHPYLIVNVHCAP